MRRRAFLRAVGGGLTVAGVAATAAATPVAGQSGFAPLGSVGIRGAKEAVPADDGETVYVATTDGFAVVDASDPAEPSVVAERRGLLADRDRGPLREVWDVKVEGDRLVAVGPANPGGGRLRGAAVFDVSDPANPELAAFHETDFSIHNCFLRDGRVYLTGNDVGANPLVAVDIDGGSPDEVARWSLLDADDAWADVDPWLRWQHDVWVGGGTAYVAHWDAGTWLLDAGDLSVRGRVGGRPPAELAAVPGDEVNAGVLGLPGNSHYAMPGDDGSVLAVNAEAWSQSGDGGNRGPGGIDLWRVGGPANPERLARVDPPALDGSPTSPGTSSAVRRLCHRCGRADADVWRTSHNFDYVDGRLFTSWYQGGVRVFDARDPARPREVASWRDPARASFWTAKRLSPDAFVASSMDYRDARGALYTFPVPGEMSATRV